MPYLNVEGLLRGFEITNDVIRDVAREHDLALLEVAEAVPGSTLCWSDTMHLSAPGSERMGLAVGTALARLPRFQLP